MLILLSKSHARPRHALSRENNCTPFAGGYMKWGVYNRVRKLKI